MQSGKDDSSTLSLELDVKINDAPVFSTKPKIAHVSGEDSTRKTTRITGDTGITQAVVNPDSGEYSPGYILSYALSLTRTASPTTEMANAVVVIELLPAQG